MVNRLSVKVSAPRMDGSSVWSMGLLLLPWQAVNSEVMVGPHGCAPMKLYWLWLSLGSATALQLAR